MSGAFDTLRPVPTPPAGAEVLLVRFRWPSGDVRRCFDPMLAAVGATSVALAVFRALEGTTQEARELDEGYAYIRLAREASTLPSEDLARAREALCSTLPGVALMRLRTLKALAGASVGASAPYHYVVETDVVPQAEAELNAWYDEEHLPGLAAVPGTVAAARFVNLDDTPRYHACYDLTSPQTLGSPPWLAVRHTAWSARVRPAFRNTRRTMFRRVDGR